MEIGMNSHESILYQIKVSVFRKESAEVLINQVEAELSGEKMMEVLRLGLILMQQRQVVVNGHVKVDIMLMITKRDAMRIL